jgi:hypothetical protein
MAYLYLQFWPAQVEISDETSNTHAGEPLSFFACRLGFDD